MYWFTAYPTGRWTGEQKNIKITKLKK